MKKFFTATLFYLFLNQLFAQDAALQSPFGSIIAPTTGCALTNSETVTIQFINNGPGTIVTDITVSFNITGPVNSSATEVIPAPNILQGSSFTYTFTATADMSVAGSYTVDANLVSVGDPNTTNDANNGNIIIHQAASVGGTITGAGSVCISGNSGNLTLSGHTGTIINWESSTDGGFSWVPISNTTTTQTYNNLTVETWYRAVVQNATCSSTVSDTAIMTIDQPSLAGTLSGPNSICQGSNINLAITAGTGSVDHWEYSTDGGVTWNIVASTLSSYTHSGALPPNVRFRVFVINGSCAGDYSNIKIVTVNPPSVGGTVNSDATVCSGNNSGTLTLTGKTGAVVRWQFSTDGGVTWNNIANTTTTQNYTNLTATRMYRAQVKSGSCPQVNSTPATITVVSASVGGTVAANVTECYGSNNDTLVLSGESGSILNWELSTDGGVTWTPNTNTSNQEIYTNLTQTTQYRVAIQAGTCPIEYSAVATVTVDTLSEGGTVSSPATHCSGNNSGSVSLSGNVGSVNLWEFSQDGGVTWDTIVNTASFNNYSNLTGTILYRVNVQNGVCPFEYSDTVTITIDSLTLGGTVSSNMTVCSGNNSDTVFLVNNRGDVINWEQSTDGGFIWSTIVNDTTFQVFNNISQNTQYRALVQNGVCGAEYSAPVLVGVDAPSVGGNIIGEATVCSSGNSGTLTLVGHSSNVVGWESSVDGGLVWSANANTTIFENYLNLTQTTIYRAIVSSGVCPNDTSTTGTVFVDTISVGGSVTTDDTLCANSPGDTLVLSGNNGSVLNWEMSSDGGSTWITLSNTTNQQIYNNLAITTMFRAQVKNGVCPAATASPAVITINPESEGGVVNSNSAGCEDYNSGNMVLTGYQGTILDWESSPDGIVWTSLGNNSASNSYLNLSDTTFFHAIVQSGNCSSDTSSVAYVTIYPKPSASFISDSACLGDTITFMNTTTINNGFVTLYNWDFGDNNSDLQTNPGHVYENAGSYNVQLVAMSNFGCLDTAMSTAFVNTLPNATITPEGVTVFCDGDSVNLAVLWLMDQTYSWNTGDTVPNVLADTTGGYVVTVTDTITGCSNSDSVYITVYPNPIANAGPDTTISIGMSWELLGSGGLTYLWTPGATLNDSLIAQPLATPLTTTTYYVTVSDINGCFDTDSVTLTLDETIAFNVPNLITPNQDGYNDTWIIPNILSFPDNSILIVNRNGQVVFEMTGYDNTWDGTYNGTTLPDGTYYYVLEIEGASNVLKGAVNILSSDK